MLGWTKVRLGTAIVFYLDLWYLIVFVGVCLVGVIRSGSDTLSLVSILVYPVVQVLRCRVGMQVARACENHMYMALAVLNVPVYLTQMLFLHHTFVKQHQTASIIAFTLSVAEALLVSLLFAVKTVWAVCTPASLVRLIVMLGSVSLLIFSLIY